MDQAQATSATAPSVPSSLGTRMMNVFTAPGELYTEVARTPFQNSSWLVPYLVSLVMAIIFTYALYANETLRHQIYDMQIQGMQKAVEEGKMTEAQLEQVRERMEGTGPVLFMLIGGLTSIVFLSAFFFGAVLFLWLATRFGLKAPVSFVKVMETYGLASFIGILGMIVALLTMYAFDSMRATPSAALAILSSFDHTNKLHSFLSQLNIFTLWETALVGVGVSKLSGKSIGIGMGVAFGLWLVWAIISTLLGIGVR